MGMCDCDSIVNLMCVKQRRVHVHRNNRDARQSIHSLIRFTISVIVPRLFEGKRRDIVFGFPSFRPSFRPSVLPSFRPPIGVCTLCAQLLLQFYFDSFETLQMSSSCFENVHVVWIKSSD